MNYYGTFSPRFSCAAKFTARLIHIGRSIKAADVEVKQKNFCANAIYEKMAHEKSPRAKNLVQSALIIALARGYVEVGAAHAHFDAVKILAAIGILRLKRDGVLIARLLGDRSVRVSRPRSFPA